MDFNIWTQFHKNNDKTFIITLKLTFIELYKTKQNMPK